MRKFWVILFLVVISGQVNAQQYTVRRIETSLSGEPPIGGSLTLLLSREQGYGGFAGSLSGTLTAYLQIDGQPLRYIIHPAMPFCPNQFCYLEVSSDRHTL